MIKKVSVNKTSNRQKTLYKRNLNKEKTKNKSRKVKSRSKATQINHPAIEMKKKRVKKQYRAIIQRTLKNQICKVSKKTSKLMTPPQLTFKDKKRPLNHKNRKKKSQ